MDFRRHKRTHGREDGLDGHFNLSGEDEEDLSGEDHLTSLEEASPISEHAYMTGPLASLVHGSTPPSNMNGMPSSQTYNSLQTLSMPMTLSQPTAINASGMM